MNSWADVGVLMLLANMLMLILTIALCSDLYCCLMWTKFLAFTIGSCLVGIRSGQQKHLHT